MKKISLLILCFLISSFTSFASDILVEAENFSDKGGWVVDQQFMDLMGSSYLMAHGMGVPVADAKTSISIHEKGKYHIYVRTYNWTSPWSSAKGPGKFTLSVNHQKIEQVLGDTGNEWFWQYAGIINLNKGKQVLKLHDLSGFNGRCDAIYLSTDKTTPPNDLVSLNRLRHSILNIPNISAKQYEYDLVVSGAGIAGMCAAMSAARQGLKVALINDRPVIGGCNSSEIRVHLGGRIEVGPYKQLGNLIKEFGHLRGGNAKPAEYYEDSKKMDWILSNKNITLYTSNRVFKVNMDGQNISSVVSKHIETGEETLFKAPLFVDCTGDGTVGALAGADYRMGREAKSEYHEVSAPEKSDHMTMGSSVQWYSVDDKSPNSFPMFEYGLNFNEKSAEKVTMGEWTWETGMNFDQIKDFERIRDYGMMVIFSNWSFLKNHSKDKAKYQNRSLKWVAYVAGKRESRRLLGDYILTGNDLISYDVKEDATAATTWSIDLHYPDPKNTENFPNQEFKSIAKHIKIYEYPVPYRCLYSRNVNNLFMAGRNISVTHMALGTTRVMRTTGMLGEVVGLAASVCKAHRVLPREVYQSYLNELKDLMKEGAGKKGLRNTQIFNCGGHLNEPPHKEL